MPTIRNDAPAPKNQPVHPSRQTHPEAPHSAQESRSISCLDDEMQMVRLRRKVHDPKPPEPAPIQGHDHAAHRRKHVL
jgi:hypothetical protein